MHDSDRMDLYMVCDDKDIRLLRHFLVSYDLFFKSPGKIYLWIWRKHEYLLRGLPLPGNLILLFKDDVTGLTDNDFKNQMYLKLIAYEFVETEYFWEADADYLIVSSLSKADFFHGDKPIWFYRDWEDIAENTFRAGSEALLGRSIPLQLLDEAQFVHTKEVSHEFSKHIDLIKILQDGPLAADQVVYGAYAYENFPDAYHWVDGVKSNGSAISYKVNQRPPSYCELNDAVKLADLHPAKYHVFWSHWEKAEEKMIEFLFDAQLRAFGKVLVEPEKTKLFRYWPLTAIDRGSLSGVDGLYSDGWLMRDVWFCIPADHRSILSMEFVVPGSSSGSPSPLSLAININEKQQTVRLHPGSQTVKLHLDKHAENRVTFRFEGGFAEPNGNRTLFSQLGATRLESAE